MNKQMHDLMLFMIENDLTVTEESLNGVPTLYLITQGHKSLKLLKFIDFILNEYTHRPKNLDNVINPELLDTKTIKLNLNHLFDFYAEDEREYKNLYHSFSPKE